MDSLPLFLNGKHINCLVVGAGNVALRKLEVLVASGARCRVVAKSVIPDVSNMLDTNNIPFRKGEFKESDISDVNLVIAATNNSEVNAQIRKACDRSNVWINAVDDRENSSVLFPSIVDRSPVMVAISTQGRSPTLARRIRLQVESLLSSSTGRIADFFAEYRNLVASRVPEMKARRQFWEDILDGSVPAAIERGEVRRARALMEHRIDSLEAKQGFVSLVGAGPGDPDLLTLKALRCLQRADIVYYDNLVGSEVLERIRRDARLIYVGKKRGFSGIRQEEINTLLLQGALEGMRVVRLKGGDPFIFGRGGEEIEALIQKGISFEVIPGITAALGAASYAGIPLTHRDWAQSVRFVSGHLKDGLTNVNWPELANASQTLVIYMGLSVVKELSGSLIEAGLDEKTPVAVISRATMRDQVVCISSLEGVAKEVSKRELLGPSTIIVGRVVSFAANV